MLPVMATYVATHAGGGRLAPARVEAVRFVAVSFAVLTILGLKFL